MGVTIHDTWATHITLTSLEINDKYYKTSIRYKIQDHFGLDYNDIMKNKFNQFQFFRIWFILQHYNKFAFRPFITSMEAIVETIGYRNEK